MGLPADIKPALSMIADVILPLEEWIKESGKFLPTEPQPLKMTWREEGSPALSVESLGFLEHFDAILSEENSFIDSYDMGKFLQRLETQVDDPLVHCPLNKNDKQLMSARRLAWGFRADKDKPRLAANLGDNVDYIQKKGQSKVQYPVSRKDFYAACWDQLRTVIAFRNPRNSRDWQKVVAALKLDAKDEAKKSKSGWDADLSGIESSQFVVALARDIVAYVFSHECKAPSRADWASAVPIELGERRRPGNAFAASDTNAAVALMKAKLDELGRDAARATGATK